MCVRIKSVCVKRGQRHTFLGVKCKRVETKPLWSNRHGSKGTCLPPVSCVAHVITWREWVMSHVWMSHVAQVKKTCRTYQRCTCVAGLVLSFIGIFTCWKTKEMTSQLAPNLDFFFRWECKFFYAFLPIFTSRIWVSYIYCLCSTIIRWYCTNLTAQTQTNRDKDRDKDRDRDRDRDRTETETEQRQWQTHTQTKI